MESGGYKEILQIPMFRQLWLGQTFPRIGSALSQAAMPLLVYQIAGSAGLMSLIFVIQLLPLAVLSPIAGLLADRLDRRRSMVICATARGCCAAAIPFTNEVWQIATIAAIASVFTAVDMPTGLAAIPTTVPKDRLVTALSLSQVSGGVTRIIGPAAGAALVGVAGPRPAFALQAICFFIALRWLIPLRLPAPEIAAWSESESLIQHAMREIGEGLRVVFSTPIIRGICAAEALWGMLNAALSITAVVLTEKNLGLGDRSELVYGLLTASASTGAVLGALIAKRIEERIGRPMLMAIGYLGPLMLIPAGLTPPLAIIFVCWFALGFTDAWAVIAMQSYLAESADEGMRGRVFALWGGLISLVALGAYSLVGWMTDRFGAPAAISTIGTIVGIGGPLLLVLTGALAQVRAGERTAALSQVQ
jgi:NRE family putative nickel resistance protein-like MFS transporter